MPATPPDVSCVTPCASICSPLQVGQSPDPSVDFSQWIHSIPATPKHEEHFDAHQFLDPYQSQIQELYATVMPLIAKDDANGAQEMLDQYLDRMKAASSDNHEPFATLMTMSMLIPMYHMLGRYSAILSVSIAEYRVLGFQPESKKRIGLFWFAAVSFDWLLDYEEAEDLLDLAISASGESLKKHHSSILVAVVLAYKIKKEAPDFSEVVFAKHITKSSTALEAGFVLLEFFDCVRSVLRTKRDEVEAEIRASHEEEDWAKLLQFLQITD